MRSPYDPVVLRFVEMRQRELIEEADRVRLANQCLDPGVLAPVAAMLGRCWLAIVARLALARFLRRRSGSWFGEAANADRGADVWGFRRRN